MQFLRPVKSQFVKYEREQVLLFGCGMKLCVS